MAKEIMLLFDGDMIAYRSAAAVEKRSVKITHIPTGKSRVFDTRTEFKKGLEAKGKPYISLEWSFEDIQTPEPASHAFKIAKNTMGGLMNTLWADGYEMAISSKDNFRDSLLLPKKYKGNRSEMLRAVHLQETKRYLYKNHNCVVAEGHEADDWLIYRAYELMDEGYEVIVIAQDKDADAYSGIQIYDPTKENPKIVLLPEFGSLWPAPHNKIKGNGFIWFCFQWLNGDSTDHYKPCELSGARFADTGAWKVLKDCKTEQEALVACVEQYKKWYPEPFEYTAWNGVVVQSDYKHMMDLYFKCARMMTTRDDDLNAEKFLFDRGVVL